MKNDKIFALVIIVLAAVAILGSYFVFYKPSEVSVTYTEKNILDIPGPDSSENQRRNHFEAVQKLAEEAEYLELNECIPSPIVLRAKSGSVIKVRNGDVSSYRIAINKDNLFDIKAEATTEIEADFGNGPGLYAYACEKNGPAQSAAGLFIITP